MDAADDHQRSRAYKQPAQYHYYQQQCMKKRTSVNFNLNQFKNIIHFIVHPSIHPSDQTRPANQTHHHRPSVSPLRHRLTRIIYMTRSHIHPPENWWLKTIWTHCPIYLLKNWCASSSFFACVFIHKYVAENENCNKNQFSCVEHKRRDEEPRA